MEKVFGIFLLYGPGLLGFLALVLGASSARSTMAVLFWGVVGFLPMALQCGLLIWMAVGSRESGWASYAIAAFYFISLLVYFPLALRRAARKREQR